MCVVFFACNFLGGRDKRKGGKRCKKEKEELILKLTKEMKQAAKLQQFEHAAFLRDEIKKLEK